ncbi:hypothetical protein [Sulfolobus sp. E11-6]|uniref:hypothetical protein n=1 Tax=Sulfolobus sp. E11-6 TaxID=2663020 RepID=UPI0012958E0C|nr:hypothetical protein [Sulfolobus sp. E11-6]QGA69189.1 hypothetical protein GFS33_11180 [Sulfolobus sp. E11-6]
MRLLLLLILAIAVISKTFMLGNYIIYVNVNQNFPIVQDVENSTIGIKFLISVKNFTIEPQTIKGILEIRNLTNFSEIIVPYYLINTAFSIIYNGIYYANITINSTQSNDNNNFGNNLTNISLITTYSSSLTLNTFYNSGVIVMVLVAIFSLGLYTLFQNRKKRK